MITIVHGPQGCGKTTNATRLRAALGCKRVLDEGSTDGLDLRHRDTGMRTEVRDKDLILTNDIDGLRRCMDEWQHPILILCYTEAIKKVGVNGSAK